MAVGEPQTDSSAGAQTSAAASLKASAQASKAGSPSAMASGQDPFAEANVADGDAFFTPEGDPADDFLRREREAMAALEIDETALGGAPKQQAPSSSNDLLDDFADFASAPAASAAPATAGTALLSQGASMAPSTALAPSAVQSSLNALSALEMHNASASQSPPARSPSVHSTIAHESLGATLPKASSEAVESEHVVRMREARAQRIAAAEVEAEQIRQARRAEASRELEAYKREQAAALEQRRRANREAAAHEDATEGDEQAAAFARWNAAEPCAPRSRGDPLRREDVPWGDVLSLMEALPKPHRDMSRVLDIVRSLAEDAAKDS